MLNQRVEELPLPGDVARQAGHHSRQRTVSLPAPREREVMVRHGQQLSCVQAVVDPVLVDHLVVPLLGLAAPQYWDYEVVQHSGGVRVDPTADLITKISQTTNPVEARSLKC